MAYIWEEAKVFHIIQGGAKVNDKLVPVYCTGHFRYQNANVFNNINPEEPQYTTDIRAPIYNRYYNPNIQLTLGPYHIVITGRNFPQQND